MKPSASLILVERGLTFPEKKEDSLNRNFFTELFDINAELQTLDNCVTFAHPYRSGVTEKCREKTLKPLDHISVTFIVTNLYTRQRCYSNVCHHQESLVTLKEGQQDKLTSQTIISSKFCSVNNLERPNFRRKDDQTSVYWMDLEN